VQHQDEWNQEKLLMLCNRISVNETTQVQQEVWLGVLELIREQDEVWLERKKETMLELRAAAHAKQDANKSEVNPQRHENLAAGWVECKGCQKLISPTQQKKRNHSCMCTSCNNKTYCVT
jgi:hypothetical protein